MLARIAVRWSTMGEWLTECLLDAPRTTARYIEPKDFFRNPHDMTRESKRMLDTTF